MKNLCLVCLLNVANLIASKVKFLLGNHYNLTSSESTELPKLYLSIYHKGQFDFSETLLGIVEVDLTSITTAETERVFDLMPDNIRLNKNNVHGQVLIIRLSSNQN